MPTFKNVCLSITVDVSDEPPFAGRGTTYSYFSWQRDATTGEHFSLILRYLIGLFIYLFSAGTVVLCFYSSKHYSSFKTAVHPVKPPKSTASSNTAILNIPSPQFTWFYSGNENSLKCVFLECHVGLITWRSILFAATCPFSAIKVVAYSTSGNFRRCNLWEEVLSRIERLFGRKFWLREVHLGILNFFLPDCVLSYAVLILQFMS